MVTNFCQSQSQISYINNDYALPTIGDCYGCPCQLPAPMNEFTYCVLKKICRKILKEICQEQRREVYTVFDGGRCLDYEILMKNEIPRTRNGKQTACSMARLQRESEKISPIREAVDSRTRTRIPLDKTTENTTRKNGQGKLQGLNTKAAKEHGKVNEKEEEGHTDESKVKEVEVAKKKLKGLNSKDAKKEKPQENGRVSEKDEEGHTDEPKVKEVEVAKKKLKELNSKDAKKEKPQENGRVNEKEEEGHNDKSKQKEKEVEVVKKKKKHANGHKNEMKVGKDASERQYEKSESKKEKLDKAKLKVEEDHHEEDTRQVEKSKRPKLGTLSETRNVGARFYMNPIHKKGRASKRGLCGKQDRATLGYRLDIDRDFSKRQHLDSCLSQSVCKRACGLSRLDSVRSCDYMRANLECREMCCSKILPPCNPCVPRAPCLVPKQPIPVPAYQCCPRPTFYVQCLG